MIKRTIFIFISIGFLFSWYIKSKQVTTEYIQVDSLKPIYFSERMIPYFDENYLYTTPKTSMYGSPRIIPSVSKYITLNQNMSPFIHQHEDGVKPNGLSDNVPWKYGTIIRDEVKSNWSRIGLWGQVYLQEGYSKLPENVGIELSNFKMYLLNPSTDEWDLIFDIKFNDYNTLFYDDNFENNFYQQFYQHKKILNNGESVVIRFDEQNAGFNFHPYSNERFNYKMAGYVIENDRPYVISMIDARLVKWDEAGIDELDQAEFIFNVGGDYWDTYEVTWKADWSANGEIGGGQFIKVTRDWRRAWFTNVPEELCDQLISENFKYPDYKLN